MAIIRFAIASLIFSSLNFSLTAFFRSDRLRLGDPVTPDADLFVLTSENSTDYLLVFPIPLLDNYPI